ncbi:MAG TPA: glycosyltransferase family 4 protein [Anaerolineae bacterium]|nr:glycosyltransferase family 4 protein [Anaerolineae bacterium]
MLREQEGFDVKLEWPVQESLTDLRVKAAGQRFFGLPVAPELLRQLRELSHSQDFLLANTRTWTIQVALASKLGLVGRCRSAAITFGLATDLRQLNGLERRLWLWMLSGLDRIIVNTPVEADDLRALGLRNVSYLVFGVDPEFWSPAAGERNPGGYVFSPGNDPLRDWITLIDACPYPLVVASTSLPVDKSKLPATVTLTSGTLEDMNRLYANCRCVAVTLPESRRIAGEYTALQAMSMGKPVVLTHTSGTNLELFKDGETCFFIPPGDVKACSEALEKVWQGGPTVEAVTRQARDLVLNRCNAQRYAQDLAQILRSV